MKAILLAALLGLQVAAMGQTNAAPALKIVDFYKSPDGWVTFLVLGAPTNTATITIEYCDDLTVGNWLVGASYLADQTFYGSLGAKHWDWRTPKTARFYRAHL